METLLKEAGKVCDQLQVFLDKAIPDARQTQQQYEKIRSDYLVRENFAVRCLLVMRWSVMPLCSSSATTHTPSNRPIV